MTMSGVTAAEFLVEPPFQLNQVGGQRQAHGAQFPQLLPQLFLRLMTILGLVDHLLEQQADLGLDIFQCNCRLLAGQGGGAAVSLDGSQRSRREISCAV